MRVNPQREEEVRRKRQDNKIKPDFAPGQGGNNMDKSPFGRPNIPNQGNMGNPNTPNQSNNPFGRPNPPQGNPFGQPNPPQGNPFGQPNPPQGNPSPFGQPPRQSPFGGNPNQGNSPFGSPNPNQPQTGVSPFGQAPRPPMAGGFGSTPQGQPPNQFGQQQNQQQNNQEDKFEKALMSTGTASANFFKELAGSFKLSTVLDYKKGLNNTFIASLVIGGLTLVFGIFKHSALPISLASALTAGVALVGNFFITRGNTYKALIAQDEETSEPDDQTQPQDTTFNQTPTPDLPDIFDEEDTETSSTDSFDEDDMDSDGPFDDDPFDDDPFDDEPFDDEEDDLFDDEDDNDSDNDWKSSLPKTIPTITPKEVTDEDRLGVLSKLDTMDSKMVSRQFIYESMLASSQKITPNYRDRKVIDEDSDKFNKMDTIFSEIFDVLGIPEEDINNISKYTETLFVEYIEVERSSKKYKLEDFDQELTQILQKGYDGQGGDIRLSSKSEFIGKRMVTKIFKGATPMVSVGDVIQNNKDFYLDTSKEMPVIMGIDEEGREVKIDLAQAESILIAGKPRYGKSFTVRHMLTQAFLFNSPDKVNFYFGDVKDSASDYFKLKLPHVKQFESNPLKIMKMLEYITYTEAERRAKLFKEAGVIKISDYHELKPEDSDMPYIYVVIDEMVGLANSLRKIMNEGDKNTPKYINIYFGYLEKLITQLPAYGIRLIAVPHRVTNNYIPKTASDNMVFKVAVGADEELLKETLNVSQKQFGYKATNIGDLSIKTSLIKPEPFYARSLVPASTSQESDKYFNFQADFWNKLKPETDPLDSTTSSPTTDTPARGTQFDYRPVKSSTSNRDSLNLKDENGDEGMSFDDLF